MSVDREYVTVVTGVPRSGTSMMMQMLIAGGLPAFSDGRRVADLHNPRGYFEHEAVKGLARDTSWLDSARGHAIKVIYRLLRYLPERLEYRVILMERNFDQVFASQQAMLRQFQNAAAAQQREPILAAFKRELRETRGWLEEQSNVRFLQVQYEAVISAPVPSAATVARFLDGLDDDAMARAVDPALYRERCQSAPIMRTK